MRNHVLRPLFAAIGLVALILLVRHFWVPSDFGVQGESFTYNYHRASNVDEWKNFPVSYIGKDKTLEYCAECHEENSESIAASKHASISCENCHGPAKSHPDDPEVLTIDRNRALCLRCHQSLPYPGSHRGEIAAIDGQEHNLGEECVQCHNPHNPNLEDM